MILYINRQDAKQSSFLNTIPSLHTLEEPVVF